MRRLRPETLASTPKDWSLCKDVCIHAIVEKGKGREGFPPSDERVWKVQRLPGVFQALEMQM